jgi:hypothetical protein
VDVVYGVWLGELTCYITENCNGSVLRSPPHPNTVMYKDKVAMKMTILSEYMCATYTF